MAQRKLYKIKEAKTMNRFRPKIIGKIIQANGVTKEVVHLWDQFDEEEELEKEEEKE